MADAKPKGQYGTHSEAGYADPGYQSDKTPRYPLKDGGELSAERIRAAWNYIHKPKNAAQYSADQVASIKSKIVAAWRAKIDDAGPPSAAVGKGVVLGEDAEHGKPGPHDESKERPGDPNHSEQAEETGKPVDEPEQPGDTDEADEPDEKKVGKRGARNNAEDQQRINNMHQLAVDLGADCRGAAVTKRAGEEGMTKEELEQSVLKVVAANNDSLSKSMGDIATKAAAEALEKSLEKSIGSALEKALAPVNESLAKLAKDGSDALAAAITGVKEDITKAAEASKTEFDGLKKTNDELTERLAKVEASPAAAKGVMPGARINKEADNGGTTEKSSEKLAKVAPGDISGDRREVFVDVIKDLHRSGGQLYAPGTTG